MMFGVCFPFVLLGCSMVYGAGMGAGQGGDCPLVQPEWAGNIGPTPFVWDLFVAPGGRVMLSGQIGIFPVDLDPTKGVAEFAATNPARDGFLTVLNPDGSYAWSYQIGGDQDINCWGVAATPSKDIVLAGTFDGTADFDLIGKGDLHTVTGDFAGFITRLSPIGQYLGTLVIGQGDCTDCGAAVVAVGTASGGSMYVAGSFRQTVDFDPTEDVDVRTATPGFSLDAFVTKLGPDGSYGWTKTIGGAGVDGAVGVAADPDGNVIVTGTFDGTVDFDPGPGVDIHVQQGLIEDSFVTKFYANGDYGWTRTYPLRFMVGRGRPAVDRQGNVFFTHSFGGTMNFNPDGPGGEHTANGDSGDLIVVKLSPDGDYVWSFSTSDGAGIEIGLSIAIGDNDDVFILGELRGASDFDPGPGETLLATTASSNGFLLKLTANGAFASAHAIGEPNSMKPKFVALAPGNQPVVLGRYFTTEGEFDADPSCETNLHQVHAEPYVWDVLIGRYACVVPTPDSSGDGFVELKEFARISWCLTGPASAPGDSGDEPTEPIVCHPGCAIQDLDADGDIDLLDLALFTNGFTGPP